MFKFIIFILKLENSVGECVQRIVNNINYISLYSGSCNGKANCRIIPSRLTLNDCGARANSYLHIKYFCALSEFLIFF